MKLEDRDFERIRDYMYHHFGLNLAAKRSLIESRLGMMVAQKGFSSFSDYIDALFKDATGAEVSAIVSKLTTNFTYFMRENIHYTFLTGTILPNLLGRIKDHDLRIWSAGCSSGEEPYSLAMTLDAYWDAQRLSKTQWDKTILATDISPRVLEMAQKGVYPPDRMNDLPAQWKTKYFSQLTPDSFAIADTVKKQVVFQPFNLMTPRFPYKRRFHVIFCRNVMIYFDLQTKKELTSRFYDALEPGGYLIIGLSESLLNMGTGLRYVQPSIYQKEGK